ncbi:SET and MYND domain-containing protein 4-like isoform X2 [Solenopsis invicta]|nr:SET and MYND domain-containing protein 4-like isoform X2 [Solenopsis invicta]XP_039307365.1 SET and MYND domain-containing protein 4-like isoform X2 [Solenopsis invicta]
MIRMLVEMPCVVGLKPGDSYEGKSNARAAQLYEKSLGVTMEAGNEHAEEIRTCNILTQALFAASANSRIFLDAICERARRFYSLRAYASCLRDCECMLALPANFYDDSAENVRHFVQRRKECLQLERECSRKLETMSSKKRGARGRTSSTSSVASSSSSSRSSSSNTLPIVDGKPHSHFTSCSDSVKLQFDEARGRHLVATRDIKPGAVLIVDRPFSFSTDVPALDRNCLHCHATLKLEDSVRIPCRDCQTVIFCSEVCRKKAWETYHRYECSVFNYFFENSLNKRQQSSYLLLAYRTTVIQALQNSTETICDLNPDFLQYHANGNAKDKDDINEECANLGSKETYSPLDYRTVFQLVTHCVEMEPNMNLNRTSEAIFLAKCLISVLSKLDVVCTKETFISLAVAMLHHLQAINCNAYEIIENVHDEATRVWEPRNIGAAIYPTVSLVNHSCYPNVVRHSYANGIVVVRALRFIGIGKGCEILDCYGPHFLSESKLNRREFLWKKYRFLCGCDACKQNWKLPLSETTRYKCTACLEPMDLSIENAIVTNQRCVKCEKLVDLKKIEKQLRKSIQKRLNAIEKMYRGNYRDAMPLLFEHADFVNKHLAEPNIEGIKTEQCIVQCYNSLGSISV